MNEKSVKELQTKESRHLKLTRSFEKTYRKPRWVCDTLHVLLAAVVVATGASEASPFTLLGDSFLPHPKHCSPSQWKILTLQSSIKGWRACTLNIPMLSFNKNRPCWKKAGPRHVHRFDIREIVIPPALMKSALMLITGCSWVKYVQVPDIQVICCRNHTAEGSKGHYKRNLEPWVRWALHI